MAEMRLTDSALRSKKSELINMRNQLRTIRNEYLMITGRLGASWEGPAKNEYVATINKIVAKVDDFIDGIGKYIDALEQILVRYENAEARNQTTAKEG